jgi:hypothetical protein
MFCCVGDVLSWIIERRDMIVKLRWNGYSTSGIACRILGKIVAIEK